MRNKFKNFKMVSSTFKYNNSDSNKQTNSKNVNYDEHQIDGGDRTSIKRVNKNINNNAKHSAHHLLSYGIVTIATIIWVILTLAANAIAKAQGAAVYSNVGLLTNPHFEPLCSAQQEHFIESDGKESSIILEFTPGYLAATKKSCTRILSAPPNYGFIVRLILPKIRRGHRDINTKKSPKAMTNIPKSAAMDEMSSLIEQLNSTVLKANLGRSCPLSIFSSLDPHTPQWRVDPCQIEDTAPEMEDPVRLFHGRVRIIWEHGKHKLNSKLMVTVLGKGNDCRNENKHQCLKIGDEPILCISKDLVCDGIRHCPYSNEYDSDEDYSMCWKRRRFDEPMPPAMESDIFEHFALEVFRNLFAFDAPMTPDFPESAETPSEPNAPTAVNSTTLLKVVDNAENGVLNLTDTLNAENTTESLGGHHHRRNSTRFGVNSDLSKYGPWGYLMLGMLLCGGALLICGLWASASQHAVNNEREAALQSSGGGMSIDHQSGHAGPPNYEELDPPPAYSVLFPNNKAASNSTLSSLATVPAGTAVTAVPATATETTFNPVVSISGGASISTANNEMMRASSSQHSQLAN